MNKLLLVWCLVFFVSGLGVGVLLGKRIAEQEIISAFDRAGKEMQEVVDDFAIP